MWNVDENVNEDNSQFCSAARAVQIYLSDTEQARNLNAKHYNWTLESIHLKIENSLKL